MEFLRRIRLVLVASAALLLGAAAASAQPTEYEVKAVFLFNFSQLVDWPPPAFAHGQSKLLRPPTSSRPAKIERVPIFTIRREPPAPSSRAAFDFSDTAEAGS